MTGDPRAEKDTPTYRRALWALFFAALANFALMHAPQALLPEIAREFGVSTASVSWVIGATTIGSAVAVLGWARLSDLFGRIRMLKGSLIVSAVLGFVAPVMPSFEWFIVARAVQGVTLGGLVAIGVVALAETVRPQVLGVALGTYVAGNTVGGLSGRVLGGLVVDEIGWRGSLISVALMAAIATVLFIVLMPATLIRAKPGVTVWRGLLSNLTNWKISSIVLLGFLNMGSFVTVFNYLSFRLEDPPFLLPLSLISWIFLTYLAGTLSSAWVWRITHRIPVTFVMLGCLVLVIAGGLLMMAENLFLVITGLSVFTASVFALHTLFTGLIARRAVGTPGESQAPSLYMLGFYSGMTVIGWLGGVAYQYGGWPSIIGFVIVIAVVIAAIIWHYAVRHGGLKGADQP